ncbi:MAG: helix-turn-helix domain-containing protein [Desulfovibrio sp.]|nr:helix-turn-helix domain-containing protein [Desulfovibrio sp.]
MNTLKEALDTRGLTVNEASKLGAKYQTLYKQYLGDRNVGPQTALFYERILGIPRSEIRPDLWPPAHTETSDHAV